MKIYRIIMLVLFNISIISAQIRIVLSAALTDAHFEFRKQQYIESFFTLEKYGYKNYYVVEALKKHGPTFLDEYCNNVFYSSMNNQNFKNNGINEARTVLEGTYHFNFDENDMIIKVTGRYQFISDYFLKFVETNSNSYDAFVKINDGGDALTLCFAMRYVYFKDMFEHIDYNKMEYNWINIETEVINYIKHKSKDNMLRVCYVDKLDVKANVFGSSTAPNQAEQVLIF